VSELTPREIVAALDRYIVGQKDAKHAVAIAIRNRWRRSRLPDSAGPVKTGAGGIRLQRNASQGICRFRTGSR